MKPFRTALFWAHLVGRPSRHRRGRGRAHLVSVGQPQKRGTLTVDRTTGQVVTWETFGDLSRGRQARSWLRFAHTGEVYGLAGQTVAGLVSAGGVVLVYTGLALAWRRFRAWPGRRMGDVESARKAA